MTFYVVFDRGAYEGEPAKADVKLSAASLDQAEQYAKELAKDPRGIVFNIRVVEENKCSTL